MGLLSWLVGGTPKTVVIADPFFSEFDIKRIALVQRAFESGLARTDLKSFTRLSQGTNYDELSYQEQRGIDASIAAVNSEMQQMGLSEQDQAFLTVMFVQYFFADVYWRESKKDTWVQTCLTCSETTRPFPYAAAAYEWLKSG